MVRVIGCHAYIVTRDASNEHGASSDLRIAVSPYHRRSLGCTLYELMMLEYAFKGANDLEVHHSSVPIVCISTVVLYSTTIKCNL